MADRPVALVTGAGRGIGWATSRELASHGYEVLVADIDLQTAAAQVAGRRFMSAIELDVRCDDSVVTAVSTALERFGRLDLLVNNAGIQRHGRLDQLTTEHWEAVLNVNLHGVIRCTRAAGLHMLQAGRGSIVNIVSVAAERGTPGRAPYAVAKAAVVALTRSSAVEWAPYGLRINAVGPGYVETDLLRSHIEAGELDLAPILDRTPMGRLAEPREIARAIRFLASPDASFITGQVLYVDGGFLVDYGVPAAGL